MRNGFTADLEPWCVIHNVRRCSFSFDGDIGADPQIIHFSALNLASENNSSFSVTSRSFAAMILETMSGVFQFVAHCLLSNDFSD
jgi:hypothetical protein